MDRAVHDVGGGAAGAPAYVFIVDWNSVTNPVIVFRLKDAWHTQGVRVVHDVC